MIIYICLDLHQPCDAARDFNTERSGAGEGREKQCRPRDSSAVKEDLPEVKELTGSSSITDQEMSDVRVFMPPSCLLDPTAQRELVANTT